jgi:hypothetical protein
MVSANWARLVVRRSFDLDLLEWTASNCLDSQTIEEIKSRRVAITRHQRDIEASLDTLHKLASAERGEKIEDPVSVTGFSLGRPNGFLATSDGGDSWRSIFWDFFELKKSMDALEKRATKIHDSTIGMIEVVSGENSNITGKQGRKLSNVATLFSIIALPFSVVPPIFGIVKDNGKILSVSQFKLAVCMAALAVFALFGVLFNFLGLYVADPLKRWPILEKVGFPFEILPKLLERDPVEALKRNANKEEQKLSGADGHATGLFSQLRRRQDGGKVHTNGTICTTGQV